MKHAIKGPFHPTSPVISISVERRGALYKGLSTMAFVCDFIKIFAREEREEKREPLNLFLRTLSLVRWDNHRKMKQLWSVSSWTSNQAGVLNRRSRMSRSRPLNFISFNSITCLRFQERERKIQTSSWLIIYNAVLEYKYTHTCH